MVSLFIHIKLLYFKNSCIYNNKIARQNCQTTYNLDRPKNASLNTNWWVVNKTHNNNKQVMIISRISGNIFLHTSRGLTNHCQPSKIKYEIQGAIEWVWHIPIRVGYPAHKKYSIRVTYYILRLFTVKNLRK